MDFFQLKVKTKLWTILIPIPNRGMLGWFWNAVGAKISWVHEKTEHSLFWGRHCQICQLWGHTNLQLLFSKHLLFVVIDNSILGKAVKAPVGYSQHFNLLWLFFFFLHRLQVVPSIAVSPLPHYDLRASSNRRKLRGIHYISLYHHLSAFVG